MGRVQLRWTGMLPGAFGCMVGRLLHASRGQGLLTLGPSQVVQSPYEAADRPVLSGEASLARSRAWSHHFSAGGVGLSAWVG